MSTRARATVRTGFPLARGNTFVYFGQPVFADATVAAIFLGSLLTARPIGARLAPDFYPIDAPLAARPRIRRLFRRLTLLWGLVMGLAGPHTGAGLARAHTIGRPPAAKPIASPAA